MKRHPAGILEVAGLFAQIKSRDFSVFGRFILPAKWACPSLEKGKKAAAERTRTQLSTMVIARILQTGH
jgi:hypothetical protein